MASTVFNVDVSLVVRCSLDSSEVECMATGALRNPNMMSQCKVGDGLLVKLEFGVVGLL